MAAAELSRQPSYIQRLVETYSTGSEVVRVDTDQGEGFLKTLGNRAWPQVLACELVGTQLAQWMKLPTLIWALVNATGDLEIQLASGNLIQPGPAFVTRAEEGTPWSGDPNQLDLLDNRQDLARLVVFDTWTRVIATCPGKTNNHVSIATTSFCREKERQEIDLY